MFASEFLRWTFVTSFKIKTKERNKRRNGLQYTDLKAGNYNSSNKTPFLSVREIVEIVKLWEEEKMEVRFMFFDLIIIALNLYFS
jgi:hypothetical protein